MATLDRSRHVDVTNCNLYTAPTDVWLNGGPTQLVSGAGTYFFAVLDPSGQGDPNDLVNGLPNTNLLSTGISTGDRTFTVDASRATSRLIPELT